MAFPGYAAQSAWSEGADGSFDDRTLRVGEVVEAIAPDSPDNKDEATKGKQWVYLVNVDYRDFSGSRQLVPYRCTVMDTFGGRADHIRHTVRRADAQTKTLYGNGDQVLVLCPNGDRSNALIVGGVRHRDDTSSDPTGAFYDFLFNGAHVAINADGEVKVEVPGATNSDGSPAETRDANNHGTLVHVEKNGDLTLSDRNGESVRISPGGKTIEVKSNDFTVICQGNVNVAAKGSVSVQAEGNADFGGKKTFVGTAGASQSLVLGNKLAEALQELVKIFLTNASVFTFPTPKGPLPIHPQVQAQLALWTAKYGIPNGRVNPILSATKFTEK